MKRSTLSGYENEVAQPSVPVLVSFRPISTWPSIRW
ncbi:MAG: hypothetical protein U5Q03_15940 [Bacteroidota bacterium]|nr:hypothetical protein [Bacteroidota bacterium]